MKRKLAGRQLPIDAIHALVERLEHLAPDGASAAARLKAAHDAAASEGVHSGEGGHAVAVLDIAWRALHTGHWARVDSAWRSAYMAAAYYRALSAEGEVEGEAAADALRVLDLGLMLGDHSFRAELLAAAGRLDEAEGPRPSVAVGAAVVPAASSTAAASDAAAASAAAGVSLRPLSGTLPPPPRLHLPPLAFFFNECMVPRRPAVLSGVIDGWPARSSRPWSNLAYLKRVAGRRTVPVEVGEHYLDPRFDEELMTLADFIERHVEAGGSATARARPASSGAEAEGAEGAAGSRPKGYLAQHQLFEQLPRLREDLVGAEDGPRINAWFGPAGTLSPLHHDRYHNLLCQVVGSKYVRLYAPEQGRRLYPHPSGPHSVSSQIIDPDDVDHGRFPLFAQAPYLDVLLRAGEVLYIPPLWWHLVESREVSFSVSFWW